MPDRMLHESLLVSERMAGLTDFEFRLWAGLVLMADNAGRGDARAPVIKGRAFALRDSVDNSDIVRALEGLDKKGCISLYTVNGQQYYRFPNWAKHQRLRTTKPKYPPPEGMKDEPYISAADCGELPPKEKGREKEEKDIEDDIEEENIHAFGKYGWVRLTNEQYYRLTQELGAAETWRCIEYVDESAQATGNKNRWKDWELTVRRCHKNGWGQKAGTGKSAETERDLRIDMERLKRSYEAI